MLIGRRFRLLCAWMLVTTFVAALLVKDVHFHDTAYHGSDECAASHHAQLSGVCYVCDFVMHKADAPRTVVFVPMVVVKLLSREVFTPQTVCRTVLSVNSHSPPMA